MTSIKTYPPFETKTQTLFKKWFICLFWLCWFFVATRALLQLQQAGATLHCGVWTSPWGGISPCRVQVLGWLWRMISCSMAWGNPPRSGFEPMSPTLAGKSLPLNHREALSFLLIQSLLFNLLLKSDRMIIPVHLKELLWDINKSWKDHLQEIKSYNGER